MQKTITATIIIVVLVGALALYGRSHIDTARNGAANAPIASVSYACNKGRTIDAQFYEGTSTARTVPVQPGQPPVPTGSAQVSLSDGRAMTLAQTISADGVRYANPDESFVFWTKGNGALVLEHNQEKSYIGCIRIAPEPAGGGMGRVYSDSQMGFSIRLPGSAATTTTSGGMAADGTRTAATAQSYGIDPSYRYQALGPGRDIYGVRFAIPSAMATGTNLSVDSYVSVEEIPRTSSASCSAALFVQMGAATTTLTDDGVDYSVATSTGAAAGNRYEETVYALPGTNPCMAVRYFVHYGAFENYPTGTVEQFDRVALLEQFDAIRRTLVVSQ